MAGEPGYLRSLRTTCGRCWTFFQIPRWLDSLRRGSWVPSEGKLSCTGTRRVLHFFGKNWPRQLGTKRRTEVQEADLNPDGRPRGSLLAAIAKRSGWRLRKRLFLVGTLAGAALAAFVTLLRL